MLSINQTTALQILNELASRIAVIKQQIGDTPDFKKWKRDARAALSNIFGENCNHVKDFDNIGYYPSFFVSGRTSQHYFEAYFRRGKDDAEACILSAITEVELFGDSLSINEVHHSKIGSADPTKIFVVHGRNLSLRNSMFSFLRAVNLRPIEWSEAVSSTGNATPYIGQVLDNAMGLARAVVVLLTPDDEVRLREPFLDSKDPVYEKELAYQARPNVLFEAGMALGRYPDRTVLVQVGTLRPFSDIAGRHLVRLSNTSQSRQELLNRLQTAGCEVNVSGTDWHSVGCFDEKNCHSV